MWNTDQLNCCLILNMYQYRCIATLAGHTAELSACRYNFGCNTIASGSLDSTAKLWDIRRTDCCYKTIFGHTDEVVATSFKWKKLSLNTYILFNGFYRF